MEKQRICRCARFAAAALLISGCGIDRPEAVEPTPVTAIELPFMAAPEAPFDAAIGSDAWLTVSVDGGSAGGLLPGLEAAMRHVADQNPPRPTRIRLPPGMHAPLGAIENVRRPATAPVVISGALGDSGERLTRIDGGADGLEDAGSPCIRLSNVSYIVVENLHCQNAFPHGVNIDDGSDYATPTHHVIVRNLYIGNVGLYRREGEGTNSDCLKLSGVDDFQVIGSEFERCVWGEFIDMVGSHRGLIAENYFHDKPLNGIQTKGGSSDILITRNVLSRIQGRFVQLGGDTGEPYYRPLDAGQPASRIRVIANVLLDAGHYLDRSDEASVLFSLNGCVDCLIVHNTAVRMQYKAIIAYLDQEEPDRAGNRNIVVANNLYLMADGLGRSRADARDPFEYRISERGAAGTASAVHFMNEVVYDANEPEADPLDVPSALKAWQFSGIGVFDPRVDPQGRPGPASPVRGYGTDLFSDLTPGDFDGYRFAQPPSAGAFEVHPEEPTPPPGAPRPIP